MHDCRFSVEREIVGEGPISKRGVNMRASVFFRLTTKYPRCVRALLGAEQLDVQ